MALVLLDTKYLETQQPGKRSDTMTKNVGGVDQAVRVIVGIAALVLAAVGGLPEWGVLVSGVVGVIALVTGSLGFCPLWTLLGINTTCPLKENKT